MRRAHLLCRSLFSRSSPHRIPSSSWTRTLPFMSSTRPASKSQRRVRANENDLLDCLNCLPGKVRQYINFIKTSRPVSVAVIMAKEGSPEAGSALRSILSLSLSLSYSSRQVICVAVDRGQHCFRSFVRSIHGEFAPAREASGLSYSIVL